MRECRTEREWERQVRFDMVLPEGDIGMACRLENGKAYLEWSLEPGGAEHADVWEACRLRLSDRQGNLELECVQDMEEEEPLVSVLMQPHLWNGTEDPYLYFLEAAFLDRSRAGAGLETSPLESCCGQSSQLRNELRWKMQQESGRRQEVKCQDGPRCVTKHLPLRSICASGSEEGRLLLNGRPMTIRAVRYVLPPARSDADRQRKMLKELQLLLRMGANCICVEDICREEWASLKVLLNLCDHMGFLVCLPGKSLSEAASAMRNSSEEAFWVYGGSPETFITLPSGIPSLRDGEEGLLMQGGDLPSSLYYQYKARWSGEPFVYLAPESLKRQKDGDYEVRCYSSCDRVALYSDGLLFEVKRGGCSPEGGEYFFQGIPARGPGIALTAEGEGCSQSLAVHKTLVPRK